MSVSAKTTAVDRSEPAAGQPAAKRSARRYVAILVIVVIIFLAGVATANYALDPMAYNRGYVREIAAVLVQGQNYATYDPNINWRALRREEIQIMTTTPDVVIFGGSRWQEAYAELLPGKIVYNAHGHSDYYEDFFAITQLLDENGRLPDTLVLSLRYLSFDPVEHREPTDWREWVPEYRAMANRLGVEPHPFLQTLPTQKWAALFSVPALIERIKLVSANQAPGPIAGFEHETLDIIGADGSLRWSQRNAAKFTPEFARSDALSKLKANQTYQPTIDPQMVADTEKLIAFLQSKGVKVVFAQTPFHPDFYQGVEGLPFGKTLQDLEALAKTFEAKYGVLAVGSFDARKLNCTSDEFIDWHHAKPVCLGRVLQQIPWLN